MGILNVTPDSFSDGGRYCDPESVERQVRELLEAGAEYIDVGGESTRPYAEPVSTEEELSRVIPAVQRIRRISRIPVSIDTTKAEVAKAALGAGADIVNDISALQHDPEMLEVVRACACPVILMHMQGNPGNMQDKPEYSNVVDEINHFFAERISSLHECGVGQERIIIDPGVGFGKTLEHNLEILKNLSEFKKHGCPVLLGHSRKSFLGQLFTLPVDQRDTATAVISSLCAQKGADIIRVHNVRETKQAVLLSSLLQ
ncbi:MAG: dihydropteroate synthase [Desulfobulbus propionicus]|nr:MAG: dihydropteroate synthase [Desulfobulbus propionicus]